MIFSVALFSIILIFILFDIALISRPEAGSHWKEWALVNHNNESSLNYNYCQAPLPTDFTQGMQETDAKLVQMHLFTRHGDRSPINHLPNDNATWDFCGQPLETLRLNSNDALEFYKTSDHSNQGNQGNGLFWDGNCYAGQLTSKGHGQMQLLGKQVRQALQKVSWQNGPLELSQAHIRSTDVWYSMRTMQSAQSLITGLFPDAKALLPLNVRPRQVDGLTVSTCPKLDEFLRNHRNTKHFQSWKQRADLVASKVSEILDGSVGLDMIFDSLQARKCHHKAIPCSPKGCLDEKLVEEILELGEWWLIYEYANPNINSFRVGSLVKDLEQNLQSEYRFHLYSAHDTTIAAVLGFLRIKNQKWPQYSSWVSLQVWQNKSTKFMRVFVNGELIDIPWCKQPCLYDDFVEYATTVTKASDVCYD